MCRQSTISDQVTMQSSDIFGMEKLAAWILFWSHCKSISKCQQISKQKLLSQNFSQKTNKRICFYILTTQKYLKLEFEIQVSSISQSSGQKNKFVRLFFGRSFGKFCFEIYRPLGKTFAMIKMQLHRENWLLELFFWSY